MLASFDLANQGGGKGWFAREFKGGFMSVGHKTAGLKKQKFKHFFFNT